MEKIQKHQKLVLIIIVISLFIALIVYMYSFFIRPLIHPFFFKINTIERLVDTRLRRARIFEYTIVAEPSYRIGRTHGVKEIYAFLEICDRAFENILNNSSFNIEYDFTWINYYLESKNISQIDFDNAAAVHVRYYFAPIENREFFGFFNRTFSMPGRESLIFIVLIKDISVFNDSYMEHYYLLIFNINETRTFQLIDFRNKSN